MKIKHLDLDTRYEHLIVYRDKRDDSINTMTLSSSFGLNYRQMIKDNDIEILGVYKKMTNNQLKEIANK